MRTNPFTDTAQEAMAELEELVADLITELNIPLGIQVVPASTRRNRMTGQAEDLAELLSQLSQQYGPDEVLDVLGLQPVEGDPTPFLGHLENEYSTEVVQKAIQLWHLQIRQQGATPAEETFLPAVTEVE